MLKFGKLAPTEHQTGYTMECIWRFIKCCMRSLHKKSKTKQLKKHATRVKSAATNLNLRPKRGFTYAFTNHRQ